MQRSRPCRRRNPAASGAFAEAPAVTRHELGRPGFTTVLMAAFVAPALLTTPLWFRLSRSWGKQRCLLLCQGFFVAGALGLTAGRAAGLFVPVLCTLLLGVCFAGASALPVLDGPRHCPRGRRRRDRTHRRLHRGVDRDGGDGRRRRPLPLLGGPCPRRIRGRAGGEDVTQTGGAHTAILLGFTRLPALLMAAALAVQSRYRLDARFTAPRPEPPRPEAPRPEAPR
ncbi:hypothetical protein ACPCI0_30575 [Streptomyces griseoincarnatus]